MAKTAKSVQPLNIASSIINSVEGVTKEWAKQRKAEERSQSAQGRRDDAMLRDWCVTIVDAAHQYMVKAYNKASDFLPSAGAAAADHVCDPAAKSWR